MQDRENSDVTRQTLHQVDFAAQFANENSAFASLADLPGVDGFVMDIDPLYKVCIRPHQRAFNS